jgi:hypothetical protein
MSIGSGIVMVAVVGIALTEEDSTMSAAGFIFNELAADKIALSIGVIGPAALAIVIVVGAALILLTTAASLLLPPPPAPPRSSVNTTPAAPSSPSRIEPNVVASH